MDALSNTTAGPPAPLPPIPTLTRRQESYARCVAMGMSYAEAFRQAGLVASTYGSMSGQIAVLNRTRSVRERIAQLRAAGDKELESTFAERASWLRLVVSADPAELSRLVHDPCGSCWANGELDKAWIAYAIPTQMTGERPTPPDATKPRLDCPGCMGVGRARVVLTPTDELSPAGRALFKGASQDKDGCIEIETHDQSAALDMLNKMHSSYVTRSLNLNANVAVHAARDANPADALKLFDAFGSGP